MFKTLKNMLAAANQSMENAQANMEIKTLEAKRELNILKSKEGYEAYVGKHFYNHVLEIKSLDQRNNRKHDQAHYDHMLIKLLTEYLEKHPYNSI